MRKLPGYFKNIAGPAAVMAAASMGAGSASSLILTGAWFRYERCLCKIPPYHLPVWMCY